MTQFARILFIGNSYTFCNEMPKLLERLVASRPGAPVVETKFTGVGGWTFEKHWEDGKALVLIQQGGWDFVVLQEQTRRPYEDTAKFREFARHFHTAARATGARTVLYQTWAPEGEPDKYTLLRKAYGELGRDWGAPVVPAGVAIERLVNDRRGIDPFVEDRRHPSQAGSYLAACCFYGWLCGESPEGRPASTASGDKTIDRCDAAQALHLQRLAWQACCDWRDGKVAY